LTLVIEVGYIVLNIMIPSLDSSPNKIPAAVLYTKTFFLGTIDGLTSLFLSLLGPLLVAASFRKTYEISMGGTMIASCMAFPFVFGTIIGSFFIVLGDICSSQ
jgi:hypothetical protein